jgi:anaerobic magnesium-protoporphyrin IX monomethyl ester cyclase
MAGTIRHPSIDYLIAEVKYIVDRMPFVRSINFHDDCFIDLDVEILREFTRRWKKEIGLPFAVLGVTPVHISEEKMLVLIEGGMNRFRIGIQSGSNRILKFYKRPTHKGMMSEVSNIIGRIQKDMIPPVYDFILDNPIENDDDVAATILMINNLHRPFSMNVFSLRSIPNTELEKQLEDIENNTMAISERGIFNMAPTFANVLVFIVGTFKVPDVILNRLLKYAHPFHHPDPQWPKLLLVCKMIFYVKRGLHHLWYFDFSLAFGNLGWLLWKMGLLKNRGARNQSQ